ncbi:unnamed protein product [Amoebophrya sp. A120]|nr:unnamed protein product [Amoebophrya sp. A120]|eukprot:GSA120T00000747001.1
MKEELSFSEVRSGCTDHVMAPSKMPVKIMKSLSAGQPGGSSSSWALRWTFYSLATISTGGPVVALGSSAPTSQAQSYPPPRRTLTGGAGGAVRKPPPPGRDNKLQATAPSRPTSAVTTTYNLPQEQVVLDLTTTPTPSTFSSTSQTKIVLQNDHGHNHSRALQTDNSARGSISAISARSWAIRNDEVMEYGWRIAELNFYEDAACSKKLEPVRNVQGPTDVDYATAISSSMRVVPPNCPGWSPNVENKAYDGMQNTFWQSRCCPCRRWEAYLGADFGKPVVLRCIVINQSSNREYAARAIAVSKEQSIPDPITGTLWTVVTSFNDVPPGHYMGFTGIEAGQVTLDFIRTPGKHCYGEVYGPVFQNVPDAISACNVDSSCQGVYDRSCDRLPVLVTLEKPKDYEYLKTSLVLKQQEPEMGEHDPSRKNVYYQPEFRWELAQNHIVSEMQSAPKGARLDRLVVSSSTGAITTQEIENVLPATLPAYPATLQFSMRPLYSSIRLCRRDRPLGETTEGSCVFVKTGALTDFVQLGNYQVHLPDAREMAAAADMNPDTILVYRGREDDPAVCAERAMTFNANIFEFLIREKGVTATTNCNVYKLPPFLPPTGLARTDGVLNIIDLYYYRNQTFATTTPPPLRLRTSSALRSGERVLQNSAFRFLLVNFVFVTLGTASMSGAFTIGWGYL